MRNWKTFGKETKHTSKFVVLILTSFLQNGFLTLRPSIIITNGLQILSKEYVHFSNNKIYNIFNFYALLSQVFKIEFSLALRIKLLIPLTFKEHSMYFD